MHRIQLTDGAWFTDRDEDRLAPAVVVNRMLLERLGSPELGSHPTIKLVGDTEVTAVITGVVPSPEWDAPRLFILNSAYERVTSPEIVAVNSPSYEMWVPPELSEQLTPLIQRDVAGALGEGFQVDVNRNDYAAWAGEDPLLPMKLLITGIAALVLLLGALGLVNISLVTVRQRIREIGIRRSFGATAGRVFFSVMMESVVASFAAGVIGVIGAILIVQNPWVQQQLAQGLIDTPPFPLEAALIGLGAATAVGALAGLLPAVVAVRVKVIDAIRF
jgi:putative ABC transport system permease protein